MTSVTTARALRGTGLEWHPTRGDRFVIPDRGMDADVFVLSDMTIEAHDFPTGRVLGFNGTTEWALDSVGAEEALWLPREDQLRVLLGAALLRLERRGQDWAVATGGDDGPVAVVDADAEEAYALALLGLRATTARDLLPLAAHDLAARLRGLDAAGRRAVAPDGARTVEEVVAEVLDEPPDRWPDALVALLRDATREASGADGVLLQLVLATWDVARATGQDTALHPACVRAALEVARAWGTPELATPQTVDAGGRTVQRAGDQAELLALTGRDPA